MKESYFQGIIWKNVFLDTRVIINARAKLLLTYQSSLGYICDLVECSMGYDLFLVSTLNIHLKNK